LKLEHDKFQKHTLLELTMTKLLVSLGLLLLSPLLAKAEDCKLEFACGDDIKCFGMRNHDGAGVGTAKATICVTVVDDRFLMATVTAEPGYSIVRSNIWLGEDLEAVPSRDGEADWRKFPHQACDFAGQEEITQTFRIKKATEIPTDGSSFSDYLVARAEVQADDGSGSQSVFAYQSHQPHAELELQAVCPLSTTSTTTTSSNPERMLRGRSISDSRSL
jgi:hypothetical protein